MDELHLGVAGEGVADDAAELLQLKFSVREAGRQPVALFVALFSYTGMPYYRYFGAPAGGFKLSCKHYGERHSSTIAVRSASYTASEEVLAFVALDYGSPMSEPLAFVRWFEAADDAAENAGYAAAENSAATAAQGRRRNLHSGLHQPSRGAGHHAACVYPTLFNGGGICTIPLWYECLLLPCSPWLPPAVSPLGGGRGTPTCACAKMR